MAGSRTYIPTLRLLTYAITKFVTRYRDKIDANLSAPQRALLTTLLDAANSLAAALPDVNPNP